MSLYIFKPHVEGPEGNITTPDIVIDRVFVDGGVVPVNNLTSETYLQAEQDDTARAAYVVTALGGGALIGPAAILGANRVIVARCAWRLNNLDDGIADVTLNGIALKKLQLPADIIAGVGGHGDTLPRGYQVLATADSVGTTVEMVDPARNRSLSMELKISSVVQDRWGDDRPKPRYSVGPMMKEVQHFI